MTDREFAELLALGHELRGVEFKGPGSRSNKNFFANVVRAALGMANRRDGGVVIIGVEDDAGVLKPVGVNHQDLDTWKYDHVSDGFSEYADPNISFELESRDCNGKKFVVLHVHEFEDIPVLCKKDYPDVLRRGGCYVRSRRKPETTELPSQTEMRDLLELATEKRLRRFIVQARAAGLGLAEFAPPTERELFQKQLGDL